MQPLTNFPFQGSEHLSWKTTQRSRSPRLCPWVLPSQPARFSAGFLAFCSWELLLSRNQTRHPASSAAPCERFPSCPGRRRPLPGPAFHALLLPRGTSETRAPSLHHLPASSLSCSACCTAEPLTLLVLMMAGVQKVLQGLLLPYTCDCKQPKQRISSTRAEAAAINKGSLKGRRETNKQKI